MSNALTQTTLAAAITTPSTGVQASTIVSVSSATGITANKSAIYVDRELMWVLAVNGTILTVMRGASGTRATTHANASVVWIGDKNQFVSFPQTGSTTVGNNIADPMIDISTGIKYFAKDSVFVGDNNAPTSGSVLATGRFRYPTITFGSTAYGSLGTAVSSVAGTVYIADVYVERDFTATGVGILNAGTVGTSLGIVGLYSAAGNLLANSALAGAVTAGANAFQQRAFTATIKLLGPAQYFVAYQANSNTDNFRAIAASTFVDVVTTSTTGAFGTMPATITVPTTFTADVGPAAYLY